MTPQGSRQAQDSLVAKFGDEANIALRIKHLMQERGWSQSRLSREMGNAGYPIHQTAISKIVNPPKGDGRRSVTVQEAIGFAKVFGVDLEDLVVPSFALLSKRVADLISRGPADRRNMLLYRDLYDSTVTQVAMSMASDDVIATDITAQYNAALEGKTRQEIEDSISLGFLGDVCREYELNAPRLGIEPVTVEHLGAPAEQTANATPDLWDPELDLDREENDHDEA